MQRRGLPVFDDFSTDKGWVGYGSEDGSGTRCCGGGEMEIWIQRRITQHRVIINPWFVIGADYATIL